MLTELLNIAKEIQGQSKVHGNTNALVGGLLVQIITKMLDTDQLVGTAGTDPNKIMNQKAVTQLVNTLSDSISRLRDGLKVIRDQGEEQTYLVALERYGYGKIGVDKNGDAFYGYVSAEAPEYDVYHTIANDEDLKAAIASISKFTLAHTTDAATTRALVPAANRKQGLMITYINASGELVVENYTGTVFTDVEWKKDANWTALATKKSVDDLKKLIATVGGETRIISSSADGNTWVRLIVGLDGCAYVSVDSKNPPLMATYKIATEDYVKNIFMATLKTINASDFVQVDGKWESPAIQLQIGSGQVQITNNAETVLTVARGNSSASAFADVPGWQETVKVPGDVFNISGGTGGMFIKLKFTVKPTVVTILS